MLEYYTVDADGDDSIAITIELLRALGIAAEPLILTMEEAFQRYAGCPLQLLDVPEGVSDATGERVERGAWETVDEAHAQSEREAWEEQFQRDFLTLVEPELPRDRPVFLTRYPAAVPTLARTIPGTPWADRWELYLGGIEVANCFGEETSPERIRSFFRSQQDHKERDAVVVHPIDDAYLGTDAPLPRCSGVALGVDRLCMYLLEVDDIERVISFPLFR
jgi:lysyl-tRNA synthetase class 2